MSPPSWGQWAWPSARAVEGKQTQEDIENQGHVQCIINISDPDPQPHSILIRKEHVLKLRSFSTSTPPHTGLLFIFP